MILDIFMSPHLCLEQCVFPLSELNCLLDSTTHRRKTLKFSEYFCGVKEGIILSRRSARHETNRKMGQEFITIRLMDSMIH